MNIHKKLAVISSMLVLQSANVCANETLEKALQYIVVLKPMSSFSGSKQQHVSTLANAFTMQYQVAPKRRLSGAIDALVVEATPTQLAKLRQDPRVKHVELDQYIQVAPIPSLSRAVMIWGLDRVDQRNLPLDGQYRFIEQGKGVTNYVIDTGIYIEHQDFQGRARHGYDFVDNDSDASDCNGHGTHVAGTIAGSQHGIAKQTSLVGVRVLDCAGSGRYSDVIAGIDWVKQNAVLPAVANMSLGGGISQAVDEAVDAAVRAGITFVVAAGNDNDSACNYSPARAKGAITVGATTLLDKRANFSNFGECLDIFAPGEDIQSTWIGDNSATHTISGTSMAAPHVAGAAALLLESQPALSPAEVKAELIRRSSKQKLSDTKLDSPNQLLFAYDGDTPDEEKPITELKLNEAKAVAGAADTQQLYKFSLSEPVPSVQVALNGGYGDADLYVRFGKQPTISDYDCRPFKAGNNESCEFANPTLGEWFVMLNGYQSYSGALLKAHVAATDKGCTGLCLYNNTPVTGLAGGLNSDLRYTFEVPAGNRVTVSTSGGKGDVDLYVRLNARPTTGKYDCRPYATGNNETCRLDSKTGGTVHILLRGQERYSGVTLVGRIE
jgi:serine protease